MSLNQSDLLNMAVILSRMQIARLAALTIIVATLVLTQSQNSKAGIAAAGQDAKAASRKDVFTDYSQQKPGAIHKITLADLPQPFATESARNQPRLIPRPDGAWPQALPGFKVELYASGLDYPRLMRTAPNGDIFLAESHTGEI